MVDHIVNHLQSNFPQYRRVKKNFAELVQENLKSIEFQIPTSRKNKKRKKVDDDDDDGKEEIQRLEKDSAVLSSGLVEPGEIDVAKSTLRSSNSCSKNLDQVEVDSHNHKEESNNKKFDNTKEERRRRELNNKKEDGPRFKDIGGIENILDKLKSEVLIPFCYPQLPRWMAFKPFTGILFHGPPGCGKTKLARAIANETGVPFYQIAATDLVSGVSGASEENIRDLFSKAYRTAPSIIFIDEIDAIASKREGMQREMERRIVTQLMTCMDESHQSIIGPTDDDSGTGTSGQKPGFVLVIGATNRPTALDGALRRPGRFDREFDFSVPNEEARLKILSVVASKQKDVLDLDKLARLTPGFVAADLVSLHTQAALLRIKRHKFQPSGEAEVEGDKEELLKLGFSPEEMENCKITMDDYEDAIKMVQPSLKREGFSKIPDVKWEDVGGLDLHREKFDRYIINRIKYPEDCVKFGVDLDMGILLYGPPGCGKTLIAEAVANESRANFIHVKGPEILNKYVGQSEEDLRAKFNLARTCAPCILFFDEVDALTTKRGNEGGQVVERLLNQFLVELDGAGQRQGVFVIGATNRPEVMDPAVLRPGRFGKLLYVRLPGRVDRGSILKALARKKPVDEDVDLNDIGRRDACEGLSGADLKALMNEAAMAALEEKWRLGSGSDDMESDTIKERHFDQALKKITPSVSEEQRKYYDSLSEALDRHERTATATVSGIPEPSLVKCSLPFDCNPSI
ncbi:hypothetical protein AQUCO_00400737v1 [Aquilegia coerulea]|uniref:AAA+ ATPase domain-containing protein n=1 Tax=Aquilegia coerulea TaxID=218851 RepID=A0A2G5EWE8_AQUCA|nr:hypothetical protein AQUCO_00400737v1 [Aquilegia coerulea]